MRILRHRPRDEIASCQSLEELFRRYAGQWIYIPASLSRPPPPDRETPDQESTTKRGRGRPRKEPAAEPEKSNPPV